MWNCTGRRGNWFPPILESLNGIQQSTSFLLLAVHVQRFGQGKVPGTDDELTVSLGLTCEMTFGLVGASDSEQVGGEIARSEIG